MSALRKLAVTLVVLAISGLSIAQQQTAPAQGAAAQSGAPAPAGPTRGNEGAGSTIFGNYCQSCHGVVEQAPPPAMLKKLTPEKIYEALTTGNMKTQAADLTDEQKVAIAEWVGGRKLGSTESGDVKSMSNVCAAHPPVKASSNANAWNGWSPDPLNNTRFQTAKAAGVTPASVARLQLKWAFGLPATSSAYGQPTIYDGRVFVGADSGYMYSIDAKSGCVHWSFQAQAGLRSTPMIAPVRAGSTQMAAYFGDIHGNVYAVDASNGELLWTTPLDPHPLTRVTAGVKVHEGQVYVTAASLEEPHSSSFNYKCCTYRGMVARLDAATGKQVWKTYTIDEKPTERKNAAGVTFLGPSGAGVWGTTTIDPKRRAVYVSTGNTFSAPDVGRGNAVMAFNMDTGKILWVQQASHGDVWHTGCPSGPAPPGLPPRSAGRIGPPRAGRGGRGGGGRGPAPRPANYYCPDEKNNPDWDFSAGVMLVNLPNGKSLVVAGQKSGMVWAYDPDQQGKLVWSSDISRGQILFGAAADQEKGYFGMRGGAITAVRLTDGMELWTTLIDPQPSMQSFRGVSAAVSVVPGVVFVPGLDGSLRAFSTFDGKPLWQYDTTQDVKTVNGVQAKGGSIGSAGATIVDGMVFVTSGYTGFQGGSPGNLLLAFGPPED